MGSTVAVPFQRFITVDSYLTSVRNVITMPNRRVKMRLWKEGNGVFYRITSDYINSVHSMDDSIGL